MSLSEYFLWKFIHETLYELYNSELQTFSILHRSKFMLANTKLSDLSKILKQLHTEYILTAPPKDYIKMFSSIQTYFGNTSNI